MCKHGIDLARTIFGSKGIKKASSMSLNSLVLTNVAKGFQTNSGWRVVLDDINMRVDKGERLGILGGNGAGKSTLIRIIGGADLPTSGRIHRGLSVSWPIAFSGGFQGSLTGIDNLRFICRIYNASYENALPFVEDFTELGSYLKEPVKTYSSGMAAKLGFAISMAIEFDCFLIDEVIAVGDERFRAKCHYELFEKRSDRSMIMVSHDPGIVREYCESASVLRNGELISYSSVDDAYEFYRRG